MLIFDDGLQEKNKLRFKNSLFQFTKLDGNGLIIPAGPLRKD